MKAIRVSEFGDPSVLTLTDVERPEPGQGEVLLRVAYAGVNYTDITARRGRPGTTVPYMPGVEASGTIERVGPGITNVAVGDRIATIMIPGAYAEYVIVPEARIIRLPHDLALKIAAATVMQGVTAHYLIHGFAMVGPGTTVLVHAAAGGVGLLLTQLATHLGAHVIGTVSAAAKAETVRAAGARDVIVYMETNFVDEVKRITGNAGVDLILDAVGKTTFPGDLEAARQRGHIVIYGGASGVADPIVPNSLMARGLTLSGGGIGFFISTRDELQGRADELFNGIHEGWLNVTIDRVLPLNQAGEAHRLLESRGTTGKLLLEVAGDA